MDERKFNLLKKYRSGLVLDNKDLPIIESMCGMIKTGGFKTLEKGGIVETAITTDLGRECYQNERTRRNPVKRFIHSLFHF